MDLWVKLDKFWRKKRFYLFSKVTLAVSKVRHMPHLPPLRYGHDSNSRVVRKKNSERKRKPYLPPLPPPLQVKWLVPNLVLD